MLVVVLGGTFVGSMPLGRGHDESESPFMVDYKQILRLRAEGVSQRGIADVLGCSRNTVSAVFSAANAAGVELRAGCGPRGVRGPQPVATEPSKPDSGRAAPDFSMCTVSWPARR